MKFTKIKVIKNGKVLPGEAMILQALLNIQLSTVLSRFHEHEMPLTKNLQRNELKCFGITLIDPSLNFNHGYFVMDLPYELSKDIDEDKCEEIESIFKRIEELITQHFDLTTGGPI